MQNVAYGRDNLSQNDSGDVGVSPSPIAGYGRGTWPRVAANAARAAGSNGLRRAPDACVANRPGSNRQELGRVRDASPIGTSRAVGRCGSTSDTSVRFDAETEIPQSESHPGGEAGGVSASWCLSHAGWH